MGKTPEQEPTKTRIPIPVVAAGVTILSLAWYGSARLGMDASEWFNRMSTPSPGSISRPEKPILPQDPEGKLDPSLTSGFSSVLGRYLNSYNSFVSFGDNHLQNLLKNQQPKEVVEVLERMNRNSITEGANVLQTAWLLGYAQEKVILDFKQDSLWIDDDHYDLSNRYETQLASAWVQAKSTLVNYRLAQQRGYLDGEVDFDLKMQDAQDDLEVLNWLRRKEVPVVFGEEAFAFFPKNEMIALGRVWQLADKLGLNVPTQVDWCAGCLKNLRGKNIVVKEDGTLEVKRETGGVGGIPTQDDGVILENTNLVESLTHEFGHVLSSKNNYLKRFIAIRGYKGVAPNISERSKFISQYAMADEDEDFAETFAKFVMDGKGFRQLIERLKLLNDPAGEVLQNKYNLIREIREILEDEFDEGARVRNIEVEKKEAEFAGLYFDQLTASLTVKPNPNAYPEKSYVERSFFLPDEGLVKEVYVRFTYNPRERSYSLTLKDTSVINKVTLFSLQGDDRIFFSGINVGSISFMPNWEAEIRKGAAVTLEVRPAQWFGDFGGLTIEFASFSPIQVEQERFIVDNGRDGKVPALRKQPDKLEQDTPEARGFEVIHIMEGPVEAFDISTGKVEQFWYVNLIADRAGRPKKVVESGWVNQRWIGQEIPTGGKP